MTLNKSKSTKRFNFSVTRNTTSKKAGSNIVTIGTNPSSDHYDVSKSSITMTVKEARALNSFLSDYVSDELIS